MAAPFYSNPVKLCDMIKVLRALMRTAVNCSFLPLLNRLLSSDLGQGCSPSCRICLT